MTTTLGDALPAQRGKREPRHKSLLPNAHLGLSPFRACRACHHKAPPFTGILIHGGGMKWPQSAV